MIAILTKRGIADDCFRIRSVENSAEQKNWLVPDYLNLIDPYYFTSAAL